MSEILATIGETDITKYIIKDSYDINSEPVYQSWQDGNFREHRIYTRDRIEGDFEVIFFDEDNGAYEDFLELLAGSTSNHLTTMGLFVLNDSSFEALQAYVSITAKQHAETSDGRMVNKMMLKIEEY